MFQGFFLVNDMQTHPPFKSCQIGFLFQKVAQCSETNGHLTHATVRSPMKSLWQKKRPPKMRLL